MRTTLQAINTEVSPQLKEHITGKLSKLEQFYDRILDVQVYVKAENTQSTANHIIECKVLVPNNTLVATEKARSFEEATDLCVENIIRQVKKYKEKHAH